MQIGQLHSYNIHCHQEFDAIHIPFLLEDWQYAKANNKSFWDMVYGTTKRATLRQLLYPNITYRKWITQIAPNYKCVSLRMNFDTYYSDFIYFVRDVVKYAMKYLWHKEIIILAGNEVFEKRLSADKVIEVGYHTLQGIKLAGYTQIPVFIWNQKIRTSAEKSAYYEITQNGFAQSLGVSIGIQSLETTPETMRLAVEGAVKQGFEVIDVELGTKTDRFSEIKMLFDNDRLLALNKVFVLTPYLNKDMTDKNFRKYALQIGDEPKDKFKLISYIQQHRDKKPEEVINKMLDEAIMGTLYKYGTRGYIVKLIQKVLNKFLSDIGKTLLVEDGIFGVKTKEAVIEYQKSEGLQVDGIVGQETMSALIRYFLLV